MWQVKWKETARKQLRKLDQQSQKDILRYIKTRIETNDDPRRFGKPLAYDKYGLWRYRIQDCRVICQLIDDEQLIVITRVGHRKDVYYP